ncbi:ABC transporter substrate-binding protein [Hyalangium rubrum]|uniref:ABC transporter substrate-binding protein n=1 Tax=Hyalangium rubrum TaxID=3103134 RepID=A0ABU5H1K2_9BACT|nr:ABC transporter substrate-binding protein [Hyalangium sp. s54d21]MDY7226633.1 ABC transporter substrate-binding protein [Hyalangium sp. s54d21]
MRALAMLSLSTVLLSGCSLTTASGLTECETSADCGDNQVCASNFCLPQPAGCGERYGDLSADAVQLGAALPLSLSATNPGLGKDESEVQGLNAILLALGELNERGVAGKKITLHLCDTAFDPVRTEQQTQWLVSEKKIAALLTAGSSQTLAAANVTLAQGVLTMSASGTSPELTTREDNSKLGLLWRTAPSDAIQGNVIADLLLNDAEFTTVQRVGILYLDDPYGQGLFNVITARLGTRKNVQAVPYTRRTENIATPLSQIDTFDPDLTVVVGFEDDVTNIIKRAANSTNLKLGTGHRWFFTDSAKDAALLTDATVRGMVDGAYGTAPAQGAGQAFSSFRSRFISKYNGVDPSNFSFTSHSYDAMYLFGLAVAYSQGTSNAVTGAKMAEGLTKVSSGTSIQLTSSNITQAANELAAGRSINVEGASGSLQFDAAGEAPSPIELWQVEGTTFQTVRTVPPPP